MTCDCLSGRYIQPLIGTDGDVPVNELTVVPKTSNSMLRAQELSVL